MFFISTSNAITSAGDEKINQNSEEYQLIKEYRETTCAFIDKNTDHKTQVRCFDIAKKLFELTEDKTFLAILADHYLKGFGVAKNMYKGLKFYEEVANSDSNVALEAQGILGIYYGAEDSQVKDEVKEEYWFKKAALNGSDFSQYHYARLLKDQGKIKEAIYWYKKAAYNGNLDAKYRLAYLLREGYPVEMDRKEAYKLLHEAAEQDFVPAFQELSFYYKEDGNKEKSNYWCCKLVNSDVFKKARSGMNPDLAMDQVYLEKKKKEYIKEVKKEMGKIDEDITFDNTKAEISVDMTAYSIKSKLTNQLKSIDNKNSLEYVLLKKYCNTECAFVDKDSNIKIQKKCFDIVNQLFEMTANDIYLAILADHYFKGVGVANNIAKALDIYNKIANSDSECTLDSQYMLGVYYAAKNGRLRDLVQAKYWLKKASLKGYSDAQFSYAQLLNDQGKYKDSLYWYKKSAKKYNPRAQYKLANFVRENYKTGINRKEAYNLLHNAAEQNYVPAFQELAIMYEQDGDQEKSSDWYSKFINTDVFKNIKAGMDPDVAVNKSIWKDKNKNTKIN